MISKICAKCNCEKSLSEFHKKTISQHHSYCKPCLYTLQKERWKDRKQKAIELMGGKCKQCGYDRNYAVLEFHHLDPSQKEFQWDKLRQRTWSTVVAELKKCILLCSNCHREMHYPEALVKKYMN